jgi:hypothetical protein
MKEIGSGEGCDPASSSTASGKFYRYGSHWIKEKQGDRGESL